MSSAKTLPPDDKNSDFERRLATLRDADSRLHIASPNAYKNGQISADGETESNWDNYDRFFKFYNISP